MGSSSDRQDSSGGSGFIDRKEALKLAGGVLTGHEKPVVVFYGLPGMGKSTLLAEVKKRHGDSLSVEHINLSDFREDFDERIPGALARVFMKYVKGRKRKSAEKILASFPGESGPARVIVADLEVRHATMVNSPVNVLVPGQGHSSSRASRRAELDRQIHRLAEIAMLMGDPPALLIDGAETITYAAANAADAESETFAIEDTWFQDRVLPAVLKAAPRLRIILAGLDDFQIRDVAAGSMEIEGWELEHTMAFLAAERVDPALAGRIHALAKGNPLIVSWLAETAGLRHQLATDGSDWLRAAHQEKLSKWLTREFLGLLSDRERKVVEAAAVLREVNVGSLAAVSEEDVDTLLINRLKGRSFMRVSRSDRGEQIWSIHPQVRQWILDFMAFDDSTRLLSQRKRPSAHRRAAAFYAARSDGYFSTEVAYHRIAAGDGYPGLRDQMSAALTAGRYDRVLEYVGLVLAREHQPEAIAGTEDLVAYAHECHGAVLVRRQRGDRAVAPFDRARDIYAGRGDTIGVGNTMLGRGYAHLQSGNPEPATRDFERARKIFHDAPTLAAVNEVDAILGLAEAAVRTGTSDAFEAARRYLDEADGLCARTGSLGKSGRRAHTLFRLGDISLRLDSDASQAREYKERAAAMLEAIGDPATAAAVRRDMAAGQR